MLLRLLTTTCCLAAATAAAAEPVELTTQTIRMTFSGSLLHLDTPAGTVIPVRFGKDGLVSGEAGVLASVLGAAHDRGRWWAERDQLCVKWFRWFEAKPRCVSVRLDGTHIYWRGQEERSGTGTIVEPAPVIEAAAPTSPAPAPEAKIELAETAPAPKVAAAEVAATEVQRAEEPQASEPATPNETHAISFAVAAFDAMSLLAPSKSNEPSHLLDAPGRSAMEAVEPKAAANEPPPQQSAAPPQAKAPAAHASKPQPKAHGSATGYASSTVILASFRVAGVDEDDMLNVRSGPSEQYATVGELPPEGHGVKIVGPCRADWCPIRHGSTTGWVNRTFLAEETTSPPATAVSR